MKSLLLATLLLTGLVALVPDAAAHDCVVVRPLDVNPEACGPGHWECYYYPEEGYIVCYHGPF